MSWSAESRLLARDGSHQQFPLVLIGGEMKGKCACSICPDRTAVGCH